MSAEEKLAALKVYFDLMEMNGSARIYRTAQELGIFAALAEGPASAHDLAEKCSLQERPLTLLLDALCSLRTVTHEGDAYSLSLVMQYLSGNYKNLSDEYWDHLPELLKSGIPLSAMDSVEQSEAQYQKQVSALAWMMQPAAMAAATILNIRKIRTALRILDVGSGAAVWSLACARMDPHCQVTALDWPAVLQIASASANAMGLGDRFTAMPGNFHEVNLPKGAYDLAIVANVTHLESRDGNISLFEKLHAALVEDGEIAIIDVMPGQSEGDLARALYAIGLALRTNQGEVHSQEALSGFLKSAGFASPSFTPLSVSPFTMGMILAKKEA